MRPTMNFSGIYGDMEVDDSSDVVTINPMDPRNRKSELNSDAKGSVDKNISKRRQYDHLKRFFEKNKDKYSDEDDIKLFRKILLLKMLTYTSCIDTYSNAII